MSVEAMAWAFKQNCKGDASCKLILLAICDHADENGLCWPSQERVAAKAECSVRSVQRKIERLERLGFLTQRRRARKTTIYRISLYKKPMMRQAESYQDIEEKAAFLAESAPDHEATKTLDDTTNTSDDTTAGVVLTINPNHQSEPSLFASDDAKPAKRRKRIPMPEDWEPDEKGILYAKAQGFAEVKIRQLVMACRDYHLKHGTLIAGSIGLAATWRTWCNNEVKFTEERKARYGSQSSGHKQTRSETIITASREYAAEMARRRGGEEISERGSGSTDGFGTGNDRAHDQRH